MLLILAGCWGCGSTTPPVDAADAGDGRDTGSTGLPIDSGLDDTGGGSDGGGDDGGPAWLTYEGVDVLQIDILADGTIDCEYRWRTAGLSRADTCEGCDIDVDLTGDVDDEASSCVGAVGFRERRAWLGGVLYRDGEAAGAGLLDGDTLTAELRRTTTDPTYGTDVLEVWTFSATLR